MNVELIMMRALEDSLGAAQEDSPEPHQKVDLFYYFSELDPG